MLTVCVTAGKLRNTYVWGNPVTMNLLYLLFKEIFSPWVGCAIQCIKKIIELKLQIA